MEIYKFNRGDYFVAHVNGRWLVLDEQDKVAFQHPVKAVVEQWLDARENDSRADGI